MDMSIAIGIDWPGGDPKIPDARVIVTDEDSATHELPPLRISTDALVDALDLLEKVYGEAGQLTVFTNLGKALATYARRAQRAGVSILTCIPEGKKQDEPSPSPKNEFPTSEGKPCGVCGKCLELAGARRIPECGSDPVADAGQVENENLRWRPLRGGSWFHGTMDCRSAYRYEGGPGSRDDFLGFRPVADAGQGENENLRWRPLRGGSWFFNAGNCRSAYRYGYGPGGRDDDLGFRPVAETREVHR